MEFEKRYMDWSDDDEKIMEEVRPKKNRFRGKY